MVPEAWLQRWPDHVWMGTTAENQQWASRRATALLEIPAAVRFLSAEPLLGPIPALLLNCIHWVIVGGESGRQARPMNPAWARDIRDQCVPRGVAFFMKQMGGRGDKRDNLDQIPSDLQVRQFPRGREPGFFQRLMETTKSPSASDQPSVCLGSEGISRECLDVERRSHDGWGA